MYAFSVTNFISVVIVAGIACGVRRDTRDTIVARMARYLMIVASIPHSGKKSKKCASRTSRYQYSKVYNT